MTRDALRLGRGISDLLMGSLLGCVVRGGRRKLIWEIWSWRVGGLALSPSFVVRCQSRSLLLQGRKLRSLFRLVRIKHSRIPIIVHTLLSSIVFPIFNYPIPVVLTHSRFIQHRYNDNFRRP